MNLTPSLVLIVSSTLGIAVAFALMMVGALWARVRSLSGNNASRMVDDLARRQESLEARLIRWERARVPRPEPALSPGHPSEPRRRPAVATPTTTAPLATAPAQRPDPGKASAVSGPTLIVVPSLTEDSPHLSGAAAAELGRRFGAIWAMADAGASPEAIAQATSHPIGQVELILGLRRQLTSHSAEPV